MKNAAWIGIGVVILLLGWFVWPTPWNYQTLTNSAGGASVQQLVRIHRVTGAVEHHDPSEGWVNRVKREQQREEKQRRRTEVAALAKATCEPLNVPPDMASMTEEERKMAQIVAAFDATIEEDIQALPEFDFSTLAYCTNPACKACRDSVLVANGEPTPAW